MGRRDLAHQAPYRRARRGKREWNRKVAWAYAADSQRGDPSTSQPDYTDDEFELLRAIEQYQRENQRPFPTWTEVLTIMRELGYRKDAPTREAH